MITCKFLKLNFHVYSVSGKERQFLRDFVGASEETSGGRFARWLQPESVIDPSKSQLIFPGVFSASVATFGVASGGPLGAFAPSSPIKTIDKGKIEISNLIHIYFALMIIFSTAF